MKQNVLHGAHALTGLMFSPGYGPGYTKIVSAIRIFCFEVHSASRCSITPKTFLYKSPLGGPYNHLGGQSWADTALF